MRHLSDEDLGLAVAGVELGPEAKDHLSDCVSCRQEYERYLSSIRMSLMHSLPAHRTTMPDEMLAIPRGKEARKPTTFIS